MNKKAQTIEGMINLYFWAFLIFGIGFYFVIINDLNPFLIITLIPVWILISFIIDTYFNLSKKKDEL